jgi:hypothetical protein
MEVRIYATKGELLPRIVKCLLKGVVLKSPIVAVEMFDLDSVLCCILLKDKLGSNCVCQ